MKRLFSSWRRVTALLVLVTFLHIPLAPVVPAAQAEDNTMIRIAKSTVYGGLLGLLLGGAVAIVVDDNRDEPIRWGLVLGMFGGFAYGIYSASTGRDDFFMREGTGIDASRYRLPGHRDFSERGTEELPDALVATPLRSESSGRGEFSPYAQLVTE
ncbi:MAG: hypothetical protein R3E97_09115 [Candidatus Eisenbacteria bacterium]